MAELLLELLSEDIPPSMQEAAAENLERLLRAALKKQGCEVEQGDTFSTPRRIGVWFIDLPHELAAQTETRRGPKISAPQQAVDGFKRSLEGVNAKITEQDGYYHAQIERPAMGMKTLLAEMIPELLQNFPWPKSMRWPQGGSFRWVRPLRSVLCILDGEVVPFSVGGVDASNKTYGHIFDAPDEITISSFEDYQNKLRAAHVLIFPDERREKIKQQIEEKKGDMETESDIDVFARQIAKISENPTLIKRKSNWTISGKRPDPQALDEFFLPEKIVNSIFTKENCLHLQSSNFSEENFLACIDGNKANNSIAEGFYIVLRARTIDAAFFQQQDVNTDINDLREKLKDVSFHPKLGSIYDKAERFEKLSLGHTLRALFPDEQWKEVIQPAAHSAKADIASQSGREFPEALGQIASGLFQKNSIFENRGDITKAISDHYNPVPPTNAGRILALADRADTLAGFFSIGEMPTGSKDPFALRRSALSIIRIILENETDFQKLDLNDLFAEALGLYSIQDKKPILEKLRAFITERLKFYLRAQDQSADFVAAAMRAESGLNLVRIQARLRALAQFLNTKDGDHLMTAWRRLSGILKETASGSASASDCANPPAAERFTEPAEHALAQALRLEGYDQALADHDFPRAFALLAQLRAPVDDFFDNVRVNVDDPQLRQNRLALCAALHSIMRQAADFSSIAGKS